MRLLRLDLLRYGHLTDVALDFPPAAALHVVLGANEAGKTTALEAIGDGLFGFGHRTTRDFLHGARELRIGLTLSAADGTVTRVLRRKGRRDTLADETDAPLPEEALRRFLGGADRALFERSFGLDSEGLRRGADALLDGEGEAGESLFAAMGLRLRGVEQALDREAASLHGDGRGRRRLAQALEAHQQARRALDEAVIRPRDWESAEADHRRLLEEARAMQARLDGLAAESDRLLRIRGTRPVLLRLDTAESEIAALADAPRLPPDAAQRLAQARIAEREAARDHAREEEERARLLAAQAALTPDAALLARQERIDGLFARRVAVEQAEADLPGILAQAAGHRATVAEAARDLASTAAPEALRDAVPPEAVRRRAQRLLTTRATLMAQRDQLRDALSVAERAAARFAVLLAESPLPADPARLRRGLETARAEGRLDAEIATAATRHARAAQATATALAALPLWSGDAAALAACPVPLPGAAAAAAEELAAAGEALRAAEAALARQHEEIAALDERMAMLARGEAVPTPALVAEARARRDAAWRVLRVRLEGRDTGAPADPDGFESLRDAADRLADRRAEDAQRVADYATAETRRALLRGGLPAAERVRDEAAAALAAAEAAWQALWAPAGLVPQAPLAMEEWRRARAELLRLHEAELEATTRLAALRDARAQAAATLRALLPDAPPGEALAPLLEEAEAVCARAEAALAAHQRLAERAAEARDAVPVQRAALATAEERLAALARDWGELAVALGLPAAADPEALDAATAAWQRIAEAAPAWREAETRVAAMRATVESFAAAVAAIAAELGAPKTEPPLDAIARLHRALAAARRAEEEAEALQRRIAGHEAALREAAHRRDAAQAELALLRDIAGAADDAALEEAIRRAARRDALAGEIAALRRTLAEQGGGLAEDRLRSEAAVVEPDAIAARLEAIARERADCARALEVIGGDRAKAEAALAEMSRGRDAAGAAQRMADALAEARHAAERYARVHIARTLLRAGVERFRQQQQSPLLRAAGAHFAQLTHGRYVALLAEQDDHGHHLLHARRADGVECPMSALSEGTRDQLYLALRVAMVETLAARMEPLPFIADDLLVTFDDSRAAAALGLLAALGRRTQVILFTHHAHVAELARRRDDVTVQRLGAEMAVAWGDLASQVA